MVFIRLPRFKRSSNVPSIRLTERDRETLRHIHRHRFLRSNHLTSLLPGSRQQTLRRLQLLFHHGYLERPRCQIDYYHQGGSRPIAYGIGNRGAGALKRELSLPFHLLDWPKKNRIARLFLEHALLISDVMVRLELACRNRSDIRLLSANDLDSPDIRKRHSVQWRVEIGRGRTCGVIPDRMFGLEFIDRTGNRDRAWFFLEADRGTMPVIRANPGQSSFHRKLLAYEATWTQNLLRTRFGCRRFRVLTVTNNPDRIPTLTGATRSLERGHGLFLFTDIKSLREQPDFFAVRWQTCSEGRLTGLLH